MGEPIYCHCWEEDAIPDMIDYDPNAISEDFGVYGDYHKITGAVLNTSMTEIIHPRIASIDYMSFRNVDISFETLARIHKSKSRRTMETLLAIGYEEDIEEIY